MKTSLVAFFVLLGSLAYGQSPEGITNMEFVEILNEHEAEALFYYQNNWKVLRDTAMARGYISGYQLVKADGQTDVPFDIVLITEYANAEQLAKSEENFMEIINERQTDGPKLLNEVKPGDFRKRAFFTSTVQLATSDQ